MKCRNYILFIVYTICMKYTLRALSAHLIIALFVLVPIITSAAIVNIEDTVVRTASDYVQDDVYMSGSSIVDTSVTDGDLVVAGGTILLNGTVMEDVLAAGGTVTLGSAVSDDVRVAGGTVTVQGPIEGDAVIAAGQIVLHGDHISGDALLAGGNITINTQVLGKAYIAGGTVYINAPIGKNTTVYAETLTLGPNARLEGNLKYTSANKVVIEPGAQIIGTIEYTSNSQNLADMRAMVQDGVLGAAIVWLILKFLMILFFALCVGYGLKQYSKKLVHDAVENPLYHVGVGLAWLVLLPVASILSLVTVIGIPFGIIGLLLYAALLIFAAMLPPLLIGPIVYRFISKSKEYVIDWKTITLGTVLYFLLALIPIIGWIFHFALWLISLSVVLAIDFSIFKKWR